MKPSEVLPISECLIGVGRPVAYYPSIARAVGSLNAAIFLAQFMYWDGKQADSEGWIYKRQSDINNETGLSRFEQDSARKILKELGVLDEKRAGVPQQLYYKFDWKSLDRIMSDHINKTAEPEKKKVKKASPPAAPPPPPKPKPTPEADPILFQMKTIFNGHYGQEYPIPFEWQGRDWGDLKKIKVILEKRCLDIKLKAKIPDPKVTDDDITTNWDLFLKTMPAYYKKTYFSPGGILAKFNKIIQDIINERKKQPGSRNSRARSSVSDFVNKPKDFPIGD